MNTNNLAKHYDQLTPWERLPLIVAAAARSDDAESERLAKSAPRVGYRLPDYWGLAEAVRDLALTHMSVVLDLVGLYWGITSYLNEEWVRTNRVYSSKLRNSSRLLAYRMLVQCDGWKLFCNDLHIDPDVVLRELRGYESIQRTLEFARLYAFTTQEALAYLTHPRDPETNEQTGGIQLEHHIDTAADVARTIKEELQGRFNRWQ